MKFSFERTPEKSTLGLDADLLKQGKRSDGAFYEWIAGEDPNATLSSVMIWLLDEMKEEKDATAIRDILRDWSESCDAEEFQNRLRIVARYMPERHPFHQVKDEFTS